MTEHSIIDFILSIFGVKFRRPRVQAPVTVPVSISNLDEDWRGSD